MSKRKKNSILPKEFEGDEEDEEENSDVDDDDDDNELGEVIDILHGTMNKRLDPKTRNRYNKILTKFFNWVKGITKLRHRCLREDDSFILPLPVEIQFL